MVSMQIFPEYQPASAPDGAEQQQEQRQGPRQEQENPRTPCSDKPALMPWRVVGIYGIYLMRHGAQPCPPPARSWARLRLADSGLALGWVCTGSFGAQGEVRNASLIREAAIREAAARV